MLDPTSATWQHVAEWLHTSIADARERNDAPLDPIATAELRGRIAALKELQELPAQIARDVAARQDAAQRGPLPDFMNPADY